MQNIDKPTASCTTSPQRTYFSRVYQLEDSTPLSDLELGEIPEDEDSDHMQHFVTDSSKKKTNSYRTESFWKSYDILYKEYIAVSRSHRASSTTDNYEEVSVWRHADRALQATIKFSELCFANPENPPPFLEMEVVKSMLILYRDQVMQRPKQINLTEYGDAVKFTHQANWQIFQIDQLVKGERPPADTIPTFQQVASQLPAQELKSQRRDQLAKGERTPAHTVPNFQQVASQLPAQELRSQRRDQLAKGERTPAHTVPNFQQVASQLPAQELRSQRRDQLAKGERTPAHTVPNFQQVASQLPAQELRSQRRDQLAKGERTPAHTVPNFQQVASQLPAQELKSQRRRSVMIARYYHALSDLDSKWLYYDAKMKKIRQQRDEISEEMAKMNSSLMRVLGMDLTQFRLQYYTNKPSPIIDD
ncbi:hypothetical protein V9T40_007085 [Parthenolecanium corni]|uniref:Uncharacterized protein n=1 Tax=Parthenolecanium corni TaxID=536013 RepID=A0AAN9TUN3_9HEMI